MSRTHSDEDSDGYLTRKGAAGYLTKKLGRLVTVGSLHRHASEGTGPPYVLILNHASYQRAGLDAWVEALAKKPPQRRRTGKRPPGNQPSPKGPSARRRRRLARSVASVADASSEPLGPPGAPREEPATAEAERHDDA